MFIPSTGKSSNSSSSSNAAAGFCWSLSVSPDLSSATTALVVAVEAWGEADMVVMEVEVEMGMGIWRIWRMSLDVITSWRRRRGSLFSLCNVYANVAGDLPISLLEAFRPGLAASMTGMTHEPTCVPLWELCPPLTRPAIAELVSCLQSSCHFFHPSEASL